jgi:hypothetical protein
MAINWPNQYRGLSQLGEPGVRLPVGSPIGHFERRKTIRKTFLNTGGRVGGILFETLRRSTAITAVQRTARLRH